MAKKPVFAVILTDTRTNAHTPSQTHTKMRIHPRTRTQNATPYHYPGNFQAPDFFPPPAGRATCQHSLQTPLLSPSHSLSRSISLSLYLTQTQCVRAAEVIEMGERERARARAYVRLRLSRWESAAMAFALLCMWLRRDSATERQRERVSE